MKCQFSLAAALWLSVAGAFAADEAVVKAARVNLRGQPTTGSEVVTQLKQGEKLAVLEEIVHPKPAKGEPAKWLRIALPANTPVWVSAQFVTNGTVAVPRLNIRSGPGENFSVIGRIPKGTAVKQLRRNGEWLEIEAPANTFAYIAAEFVNRPGGGAAPVAPVSNPGFLAGKSAPKAPAKGADKAGKQFAKAAPIAAPETKPELVPVEVKPIAPAPVALPPGVVAMKPAPVAPPTAVLTEPVVTATPPPVTAPAPAPAPVAPPAALTANVPPPPGDPYATTGRYKIEPEPQKGFGTWMKGFFSKKPAAEKSKPAPTAKLATPADDGPPTIRIVSREGIVARSWNIQTPSDWALQDADSGRVINYLWSSSTNIPWATLKGRTIIVTGEEALDVRWPTTPVLKIETLRTVDE